MLSIHHYYLVVKTTKLKLMPYLIVSRIPCSSSKLKSAHIHIVAFVTLANLEQLLTISNKHNTKSLRKSFIDKNFIRID